MPEEVINFPYFPKSLKGVVKINLFPPAGGLGNQIDLFAVLPICGIITDYQIIY